MKQNFNIITTAIENYVKECEITSTDDFILTRRLTDIVLNQNIYKLPIKFTRKVPLKKSIQYVDSFLKHIDKSCSDYFHKRLEDGTFIFEDDLYNDKDAYSDYDSKNNKRIIYIPLRYNIFDSSSIVHELFHDMNLDETETSIARLLFTEGISTSAEMLYIKFLIENKVKDANILYKYLFYGLRYRALKVDYNLKLLEQYINNDNFNINHIFDIYEEWKLEELEELITINDEIIIKEELTLDDNQIYMFGFPIAMYLYDHIKRDESNIYEIFELNEMLKKYSIENVFDYLDIPYSDGQLKEEAYIKIEKVYKQIVKRG